MILHVIGWPSTRMRPPHLLDSFQRIYVINLASRSDRRAEMAAQLAGIGVALDGSRIRLFEAVRPVDAAGFPNIGARGCFMSHLGVLREATAAGLHSVLILEDDLNFVSDFAGRSPQVLSQLASVDWSVFYGGYGLGAALGSDHACVAVSADLAILTSHFVGFSGAAIEATAAYLNELLSRPQGHPDGGPMHVDGAYNWFRRTHPACSTWLANPPLGFQRASRTDIHDVRWFDRLPGLRRAVAALRAARNQLDRR